jgi:hypothetical protein
LFSRQNFLLYFGKGKFGGKKFTLQKKLFEIYLGGLLWYTVDQTHEFFGQIVFCSKLILFDNIE